MPSEVRHSGFVGGVATEKAKQEMGEEVLRAWWHLTVATFGHKAAAVIVSAAGAYSAQVYALAVLDLEERGGASK